MKGEYLNKAKISDGGKKLRKNWTTVWVVLDSEQLLLYKESKQEALTNLVIIYTHPYTQESNTSVKSDINE